MKYEYLKGSEKDFVGAPEWANLKTKLYGDERFFVERHEPGARIINISDGVESKITNGEDIMHNQFEGIEIIAERRPITDESDLNECIGQQESHPPVKFPCESHVDYHFRVVNWAEEKAKPEAATEEFIDDFVTFGKYDRQCKGVVIDVYDVLQAFEVVNPALQHLIKKALCAGLRGHKKREQDLVEILESAKRAIELEGGK